MLCRLAQALSCVLACIGCAGSTARPSADEVSRGGSRLVASATGATCAFDETAVLEAGERLATGEQILLFDDEGAKPQVDDRAARYQALSEIVDPRS